MEFKMLEDDRFLLKFFHSIDRQRVLASSPWAFDKNPLVLAPVESSENLSLVDLDYCDFHIHIHGLPIGKMMREVASFVYCWLPSHMNDCPISAAFVGAWVIFPDHASYNSVRISSTPATTPLRAMARAIPTAVSRHRVVNLNKNGSHPHTRRPTFQSNPPVRSTSTPGISRRGTSIFGDFLQPPNTNDSPSHIQNEQQTPQPSPAHTPS
ncbi:hypothetical protein Salat_2914400 [Sesamum alatum]|uniref:DUF4283 domain-containing protein n=1 Tax=Sesamum alatum TaxID=300844 RepID=A0AAE1XJ18_9LAMI|nr:hypothetical protein Salat_2914400 [Sesamum alatum]